MPRFCAVVALTSCLAGCDLLARLLTPVPFALEVTPEEIRDSIVGQRIVLLVKLTDEESRPWPALPIRVSATAKGALVTVTPSLVAPFHLAEITVIPQSPQTANQQLIVDGTEGWSIEVMIEAERCGLKETAEVPITVISEEPDLVGPLAAEVRDMFLPWLAENHPELGIGPQTQWTGRIVTPHILVVTHYLYFSDDWEMHVFWHVMIPPYDWARIELRRRFQETTPSLAFEIPSRSASEIEVNPIEPSETLWR